MRKDIVSIMIPCYNGVPFLEQLFDTIARQTYKKLQVVIVNDGSTDNTESLIKDYEYKIKREGMEFHYLYQENRGQAAAINNALQYIDGEYCMWFDADDLMTPDHVEKKVNYLRTHPQDAAVICNGYIYHESDLHTPIGMLGEIGTMETIFEDILLERYDCWFPGLWMVRTEKLFKVLPEKNIYESRCGQNMQLLLPLTLQYRTGYLPEKLFHYIIYDKSHSHCITGGIQWMKRYDALFDLKKHVIEDLPISKDYYYFLIKQLTLFLLQHRIGNIDDEVAFSYPDYVLNVCRDYIARIDLSSYQKKRQIYYWGYCPYTKKVSDYLQKYCDVICNGYIDSNIEKCNDKKKDIHVLYMEDISKDSMYIIVPLNKYYTEIVDILNAKGFVNGRDYYYPQYELRVEFKGEKK